MLGNAFDRNQSQAALADWLATRKFVQVGAAAVKAHLARSDTLGPCPGNGE